jgi:hypothetical protein
MKLIYNHPGVALLTYLVFMGISFIDFIAPALDTYVTPIIQTIAAIIAVAVAVLKGLNYFEDWIEKRADRVLNKQINDRVVVHLEKDLEDDENLSPGMRKVIKEFVSDYKNE